MFVIQLQEGALVTQSTLAQKLQLILFHIHRKQTKHYTESLILQIILLA